MSNLARYSSGYANVGVEPVTSRTLIATVSPAFFDVFYLKPLMGRWPAQEGEAAVSRDFWRVRMASDRTMAHRLILNGRSFAVVGVVPEGFRFPVATQVWVAQPVRSENTGETSLGPASGWVGRARPGTNQAAVAQEMNTLLKRLGELHTARTGIRFGDRVNVVPLRGRLVTGTRESILAVTLAALAVLLIAFVNVFGLLRAALARRRHEIAVRAALGASLTRIVFSEMRAGMLRAVLASAAAALASHWFGRLLEQTISNMSAQLAILEPRVEPALLSAAIAFLLVMSATALSCVRLARQDHLDALRESGLQWIPAIGTRAFVALFALQLALGLALGAGASATARSYLDVRSAGLGFEPAGVHQLRLAFLPPAFDAERAARTQREILDVTTQVPGVLSASLAGDLPMYFGADSRRLSAQGTMVTVSAVAGDYFGTLGIPVQGAFERGSPAQAVVSEAAGRLLFGDTAMDRGRTIHFEGEKSPRNVVGIAANVRSAFGESDSSARVYIPIEGAFPRSPTSVHLIVRCGSQCQVVIPALRARLNALRLPLPVDDWQSMPSLVAAAQAPWRAVASILGIFAAATLLISGAGSFALAAMFSISRMHEIGVRLACGGAAASIVFRLLRTMMLATLVGLAAGTVVAVASSRWLASIAEGTGRVEPGDITAAAIAFAGIVLVAAAIPATRAAFRDPLPVLQGRVR
ncbi:MAG: ABC transporter permease [Bryobacteraceae bacterium]|nr:ABC transporter permease [Bryobacteraceae bacterium]